MRRFCRFEPLLIPSLIAVAIVLLGGVPAAAQDPRPPERHALLIGINIYEAFQPGDRRQLKYATNDVDALEQELGQRQGWKVEKLSDRTAKREEIVKALTDFTLSREAGGKGLRDVDTFLLFFAGHGKRHPQTGQVYWMTHDTLPRYPDVNNIRLSHLMELVAEIPAGKKIVLLDHCFSGEIDLPGAGGGSGARDPTDTAAPRTDSFPDDELMDQLSPKTKGLFVISAARGLALEFPDPGDPSRGHGLFTTALLEALRTTNADVADPRGKLTIEELSRYLVGDAAGFKGKVQILAEARQAFQMAQSRSTVTGQLGWIVADSLAGGGAGQDDSFRETLDRWLFNGWIATSVFSQCQLMLDAWKNLDYEESELDDAQREILERMRQVIPSAIAGEASDKVFAETLARSLTP